MIRLEEVGLKVGGFELDGVSLDIPAGGYGLIIGPTGSGKTSLLEAVAGHVRLKRGRITLDGRDVTNLAPESRGVGFVYQAYHLFPELNAIENVCLPARMARVPVQEAAERGRHLLKRVGLAERMEHRPAELSGGEQQRVAIARAMINDPEVILADEPTGNLDSHTGEEIMDLLLTLRAEKQTTLIIATHDARLAERAPRVIQLMDGQVSPSVSVPS